MHLLASNLNDAKVKRFCRNQMFWQNQQNDPLSGEPRGFMNIILTELDPQPERLEDGELLCYQGF